MAENGEVKQQQEQPEAGTPDEKKKKKKPNFSKPFIISGVLLGLFAGAPFLNLGNYVFGLWGWIFGLLAAWFLSKEFKYFQAAHGGMVGFFTGLIGSGIAMAIDIGLCLAGFSTFTLVPALKPALEKITGIMSFWIPKRFHNAIILPTWGELHEIERVTVTAGKQAISPVMTLTGHGFFMVPLLAGTAILGGIIGWKLFAKPAPKKKLGPPRRRRPADAEQPQVASSEDKSVEEAAEKKTESTGTKTDTEGQPAENETQAGENTGQPESYNYDSRLSESGQDKQKPEEKQEDDAQQKNE
jgi:hypothetical protein